MGKNTHPLCDWSIFPSNHTILFSISAANFLICKDLLFSNATRVNLGYTAAKRRCA